MLSHHSARITIGKCGWPVSGLRLTGSNPNPAGAPYVQRAERVRDRAKKSSEVRAEQGWEQGWVGCWEGSREGKQTKRMHASNAWWPTVEWSWVLLLGGLRLLVRVKINRMGSDPKLQRHHYPRVGRNAHPLCLRLSNWLINLFMIGPVVDGKQRSRYGFGNASLVAPFHRSVASFLSKTCRARQAVVVSHYSFPSPV